MDGVGLMTIMENTLAPVTLPGNSGLYKGRCTQLFFCRTNHVVTKTVFTNPYSRFLLQKLTFAHMVYFWGIRIFTAIFRRICDNFIILVFIAIIVIEEDFYRNYITLPCSNAYLTVTHRNPYLVNPCEIYI